MCLDCSSKEVHNHIDEEYTVYQLGYKTVKNVLNKFFKILKKI